MEHKIQIVYDKQCPACSKYCELVQASAYSDQVSLVDARDESELMLEITHQGLDIDEGMVVAVEGELYYGADAIHALAVMSKHRGLFNRFSRVLFKSRRMAQILYPLMRSIRNLLLRILGVRRINNLKLPGRDKF